MNKKTTAGILAGTSMLMGGGAVVDNQINPYTDVGTQKEIRAESVIPSAKATRILADTTKPKVTIEKFGGEVALGVSYDKIKAEGSRPLFSKNMEWDGGNEMMEMVPIDATTTMEDGGMEINIHLAAKPASNVFTFQLENWENLDFFYQPELTAQDIAEGAYRPENVVGSYAVYYKNHANHIEGQTNYATGKAYHIFRPKVYDDNGAEVWAEMSYNNGVLTVTVPQDFLDKAAYPVVVDPTFGYTTIGGTTANSGSGVGSNEYNGGHSQAGSAGTVTSISLYAKKNVLDISFQGGLYRVSDAGFVTGNGSAVTVNNTTPQWWDSTGMSVAITAQNYYVAFIDNGNSADGIIFYFDSVAAANRPLGSSGVTYPTFPATAALTSSVREISIYATYTAGGGSTPTTIYGATLQGATIY